MRFATVFMAILLAFSVVVWGQDQVPPKTAFQDSISYVEVTTYPNIDLFYIPIIGAAVVAHAWANCDRFRDLEKSFRALGTDDGRIEADSYATQKEEQELIAVLGGMATAVATYFILKPEVKKIPVRVGSFERADIGLSFTFSF